MAVNQVKRNGSYAPLPKDVAPLSELPSTMRAEIEALVAAPTPPPRWLNLGDPIRPIAQIPSRAWFEWHWRRGKTPGRRPTRPRIPPDIRQTVFERDQYACVICGAIDDLTLDHIHPWSRGGADIVENLRVLCRSCNSKKGARV